MLNSWNIYPLEYEYLFIEALYALLLTPLIYWLLARREKQRRGDWKFGGTEQTQEKIASRGVYLFRQILLGLKTAVFVLLVFALAKPFRWNDKDAMPTDYKFGIDLYLAIDVSLSMYATDFSPNRLEVAKEVAKDFIDGRKGDRIGVVAYAGEAYTACPATIDYDVVKEQIDALDGYDIEPGTAIGTGLGTAVVHLKSDSLKSKVVILLTDGSNNAGDISPIQAAELAKQKNVCVYTIGVGTNGLAPTPIVTPIGVRYENLPVEIDEITLQEIANKTGGKYFRATDKESLKKIYEEIEKMEKRKMENKFVSADPPPTPMAFLNWTFVFLLIIAITEIGFFIQND
ncbi:MAG: hypothetical protein RL264_2275 [Bacteroidota bacterium]|jgi:Ca-activated chloride channel family protein